jgi:putative ATP-dependent endonuclease of the OLD family
MRLVSFTVNNYRSITNAYKLAIDDLTVIIGPNNEGKSNILRALHTGLGLLVDFPRRLTAGRLESSGEYRLALSGLFHRRYSWTDDFPMALQISKPNGRSLLVFEFELTPTEILEFKKSIKSNLNGTLSIQVALGDGTLALKVIKRGPGAQALTRKVAHISQFVADHLDYEYIPAVRTANASEEIVEEMVGRVLAPLEQNTDYKLALQKIAELQAPILAELSRTVKETLNTFLPGVRDVKVQVTERERAVALRRACQVIVDDGTPTLLRQKGDGVQSLAALGLIRKSSESTAGSRQLVMAIEEPESHLHPKAIHELRKVLLELAEKHQIVVTTHCPLLVNRVKVAANVVVEKGKARPASSIRQIRELLGVRASDNLQHAILVLVVEGEDDRLAMGSLLRAMDAKLSAALDDGSLALDSLAGGTNLAYKLGSLRDALCNYHAWLDADRTGRKAFDDAAKQGLISNKEVHFSSVPGRAEAEMEDLYSEALYEEYLNSSFGVSIRHPKFSGGKKWSERLRLVFETIGKNWNDSVKETVKRNIAELASRAPTSALEPGRAGPITSLTEALRERLRMASS